jgi:hypothetical protein
MTKNSVACSSWHCPGREEHLTLYAPNKQSNGRRQSRSSFIGDISGTLFEASRISTPIDVSVTGERFTLEVDGIARVSPSQLATYEKVPAEIFLCSRAAGWRSANGVGSHADAQCCPGRH